MEAASAGEAGEDGGCPPPEQAWAGQGASGCSARLPDCVTVALNSIDGALGLLGGLGEEPDDDQILRLRLGLLRTTGLLRLVASGPTPDTEAARRLARDIIGICTVVELALRSSQRDGCSLVVGAVPGSGGLQRPGAVAGPGEAPESGAISEPGMLPGRVRCGHEPAGRGRRTAGRNKTGSADACATDRCPTDRFPADGCPTDG